MTRQRLDGKDTDEFREWIRKHPRLESTRAAMALCDCDLLLHKFKTHHDRISTRDLQHMMWVEYKRFGADMTASQEDTFGLFHQLFRSRRRIAVSRMCGRRIQVTFWGVHLLQMSGATPEESVWLRWDRKPLDLWTLEQLLRFELNPFTFKPIRDRRHHKIGRDGY